MSGDTRPELTALWAICNNIKYLLAKQLYFDEKWIWIVQPVNPFFGLLSGCNCRNAYIMYLEFDYGFKKQSLGYLNGYYKYCGWVSLLTLLYCKHEHWHLCSPRGERNDITCSCLILYRDNSNRHITPKWKIQVKSSLCCPDSVLTNGLIAGIVPLELWSQLFLTLKSIMHSLSAALGIASSFFKCYTTGLFQMSDLEKSHWNHSDLFSSSDTIMNGDPQGSTLGPIIFL